MELVGYFLVWAVLLSPVYLTCAVIIYGVLRVTKYMSQRSLVDSVTSALNSPAAKNIMETAGEMLDRWLSRGL